MGGGDGLRGVTLREMTTGHRCDSRESPSEMSATDRLIGLTLNDVNNNPNRRQKRIVHKNGTVNLASENIDLRKAFLRDMFTTMIDIKWRWNLLVFLLGFVGSWFFFALFWWFIAYIHHDLDHANDPDWKPCVAMIDSFSSAFLFSLESQHTIGYGFRHITDHCPDAIVLLCLQAIVGVMIQGFVVGFVFSKLTRPQRRSETIMFSKNAIIGSRNGSQCFSFRIGDLRNRSNIIGAKVSAVFVGRKSAPDGSTISYFHQTLPLTFDGMGNDLFLVWPAVISHIIDEQSPLKTMTPERMTTERFEIIVLLEGTIESTGQLVQARTSYLTSEILWDFDFEKMVQYRKESGHFTVDYSKFNSVKQVTSM